MKSSDRCFSYLFIHTSPELWLKTASVSLLWILRVWLLGMAQLDGLAADLRTAGRWAVLSRKAEGWGASQPSVFMDPETSPFGLLAQAN
jgi:hypothetical protein